MSLIVQTLGNSCSLHKKTPKQTFVCFSRSLVNSLILHYKTPSPTSIQESESKICHSTVWLLCIYLYIYIYVYVYIYVQKHTSPNSRWHMNNKA